MAADNSLASFDHLTTEILFEIFDYLSYNDAVDAFSSRNQRITDILFHYRRLVKSFTTPTRDFASWQMILPTISSQIEYLTITTTEFPLSLDLFPNIKSLVIDSPFPIDWNQFISLLKCEQFKKLKSLKIKNEIIRDVDDSEMPFFYNVLKDDNSLRVFEFLSELCFSYGNMNQLKINLNLRSLALRVVDLKCLLSLLRYTPNLKYLNLSINIFGATRFQIPSTTVLDIKLKKCLIFIQCGMIHSESFPLLTWFIKQFSSSLVELSLNLHKSTTDRTQFTGLVLQQQLLESMVRLKSLHLYIQLDAKPVNDEIYLSTFRNSFWFDHHWRVAIHKNFLYTLPFHFDTVYEFSDFNRIKSSNESVLDSLQVWSRVKTIQFAESFQFHSNIIEQLQMKMPNLRSIVFTSHLAHSLSKKTAELSQIDRTLDNVTTVHCSAAWLQDIKDWLLHIVPDIKCVMLSSTVMSNTQLPDRTLVSQEFDEYLSDKKLMAGRFYPFKIQHAEIQVTLHEVRGIYQHVVRLLRELLEMSECLQAITFHFYHLPRFPSITPYTDLDKIIDLFNIGKMSERYHIRYIQNYMQFFRKKDNSSFCVLRK